MDEWNDKKKDKKPIRGNIGMALIVKKIRETRLKQFRHVKSRENSEALSSYKNDCRSKESKRETEKRDMFKIGMRITVCDNVKTHVD